MIVNPIGKEFALAAENSISSVPVHDPEPLVEPSFGRENADKLAQNIHRLLIGKVVKRCVFPFHGASFYDGLVKSRKTPFSVIPVKTGIQVFQPVTNHLDPGFHRGDDFLRDRQS